MIGPAAHIIRSLRYKATVSIPSGAHGGRGEDLGEDGVETALYQISKERQFTWRGNRWNDSVSRASIFISMMRQISDLRDKSVGWLPAQGIN